MLGPAAFDHEGRRRRRAIECHAPLDDAGCGLADDSRG